MDGRAGAGLAPGHRAVALRRRHIGFGGLVGYLGTGSLYDLLQGHRLFAVAAVAALVPAVLLWFVNPRRGPA